MYSVPQSSQLLQYVTSLFLEFHILESVHQPEIGWWLTIMPYFLLKDVKYVLKY